MPTTLAPSIRVERAQLANGLRVVLVPDKASTAVFVGAHYDVGFRSEPEGRTGFAHLFEHLTFQGSATLEKGVQDELVGANGGVLNGSTRNDFTNYFELMPSNALEIALFLEADRMRGIRLTPENLRNQVDVVKEEIRVNVRNQPYGGFPWLDLPKALFATFPNAHDSYGDFRDLEAATMDEAQEFFDRYYAPGNCVLGVAGDLDPDETIRMVERHFGDIPGRPVPQTVDASEPPPAEERRVEKRDERAPQPAVAFGYRVPDPIVAPADYAAAILASSVLTDGEASRLHQRLVKRDRVASHVLGGVGLVAGPFEVRGPSMLQVVAFYPGEPDVDRIARPLDDETESLGEGVEREELERFRNAMLAGYLGDCDSLVERGMLVAALEQQRGRAELINEIPALLQTVEPQDVARIAREWLRPERRAVVDLRPGAAP